MKLKVIDKSGKEASLIDSEGRLFNSVPNDDAIYRAIHNERANKRLGTASTKDRGNIRGSTKKPWKQKGTGRSRAGTTKSPIWRGGGVTFGPSPRDYSYRLPKKLKRLSIISVLNKKLLDGKLRVLDGLSLKEGKTKEAYNIFYDISLIKNEVKDLKNNKLKKKLNSYRLIIITDDSNANLKQSTRNIPWVRYLSYKRLNVYDLFYSHEVILDKAVLSDLEAFYAS